MDIMVTAFMNALLVIVTTDYYGENGDTTIIVTGNRADNSCYKAYS